MTGSTNSSGIPKFNKTIIVYTGLTTIERISADSSTSRQYINTGIILPEDYTLLEVGTCTIDSSSSYVNVDMIHATIDSERMITVAYRARNFRSEASTDITIQWQFIAVKNEVLEIVQYEE